MRFVEIITIYLAISASVGAACFLRLDGRFKSRARATAVAFVAALFFPLTILIALALRRRRLKSFETATNENDFDSIRDTQIERANRAVINALHIIEEKIAETFDKERLETLHQIISTAINHTDRYTGLSIAVADSIPDGAPSTREMELCNVAGRTNEDLSLAGRCIHRRNVARLRAHSDNARDEFVYSLRIVRASVEKRCCNSTSGIRITYNFATLILQIYERAIELALLFDDRELAITLARECDTECTRQSMELETRVDNSTKNAVPLFDELPVDLAAAPPARPVI